MLDCHFFPTTPSRATNYWARCIVLVDMNAFFAAVEQHDNPRFRGMPVGITNGDAGTCLITCSYEARTYGVKTGMRLKDGLALCPHLITIPSRPKRYAEVSRNIMHSLQDITPDIEVFSVDEAFLDVTRCQKLLGPPEKIGLLAKKKVFETSGLLCSVGVSGDKTTAKYAAKVYKPNGFCVIPPWEAKARLKDVPVTELCGIAEGIGNFLKKYGVYYCGDMEKLPISILAKRFGHLGRRIWLMCQGEDPDVVKTTIDEPKSMGHGKVMPPHTRDAKTILVYLAHMCEKLAARLRRHHLQASHFYIGWKSYDGWLGEKCALPFPTADGKLFYHLGKDVFTRVWHGQGVHQVQVTALDPQMANTQTDLFADQELQYVGNTKLNTIVDNINDKYGEFTIAPAQLLLRSKMHNVIAPAWKPFGHRQSIR